MVLFDVYKQEKKSQTTWKARYLFVGQWDHNKRDKGATKSRGEPIQILVFPQKVILLLL